MFYNKRMTNITAREYYDVAPLSAVDNGIYEVTFITEGTGSSGYYSRELLERYGAITFGEGVLNFYNHTAWYEDASSRDVRTVASKILESWFVVEDNVGKVKGKVQVAPSEREYIDFIKDSIGMSISVKATAEFNEDTGELDITSFDTTDPYRSVDYVVAAGRGGKIEQKLEAYRDSAGADKKLVEKLNKSHTRVVESFRQQDSTPVENLKTMEGDELDIKDVEKLISDALAPIAQSIENLVSEKNKQDAEAVSADAIATATQEAVAKFAEASKAIAEANLLDSQSKALLERASKGEDVADAIVEAKAIADEAKAKFSTSESAISGTIHEGSATSAETIKSIQESW